MNRVNFALAWTVRTAVMLWLTGPVAMTISFMAPMAMVALEASTMHYDQPIFLVEEYLQSGMSFVELQLYSIIGYHVPEGSSWLRKLLLVALNHGYHHLMPNIIDSEFPKEIIDE